MTKEEISKSKRLAKRIRNLEYYDGYPYPKIPLDYPVMKYCLDVLENKIKVCTTEALFVRRFAKQIIKMATKPKYPYVFDMTRANRFFAFSKRCIMSEGEFTGQPFQLQNWQLFDWGNIFGWVEKETGKRQYTSAFIYMPRGNAKSTVSSLCSLYGLNADCFYPPYQPKKRIFSGEPVVLTLAVDKKQAQIVREGAMSIANYSPYVLKFAECKKTYIVNKKRGGRVEACSSDAGNKDGLKPDIVICDEWAAQKTDKALNTMVGGFGKKPQPLLIKITTAGDDCQSKPAKIDYDYSLDILKGVKKDEHYYISIRQADDDVKVNDFKRFGEFTPMLRIGNEYSKTLLKAIKNEYKKAYDSESPNKIREYLIKRLNRWQQDSEEKFLDTEALEKIKKCMIDPKEFDELIRGENYVGGYDMSIKVDLTARALWYKLPDGRYALDTKGFIPADSIDRHEHTDLIPYRYWIQQGYVDSIRGMVIDTNDVMEELMDYEIRNHVFGLEIVYDAAWATQFAADMSAGRNSRSQTYTMIECPQTTTRLNEPTNKFEELLMAGKIVIKRNDCFLWCCENAYIQYDNGGRRKIAKKSQKSPKRIDLLAAAIFGLVRVSTLEQGNLQHELETGTFTF